MYIIKSRKEMKDAIDMDRKYYDTQNDLFMKRTNDHLVQIKKYMYCLRHEQYYISKNNKLGRLLRLYWARRKNTIGNRIGFYIGATVFEPGITIYHHGTIIINGNAVIGQGCCLHGNNCIGNDGKSGGAPVIGKNVDIGFGAVIIGDIQIADNCKIGAGAVVVHSCLEEGSTLVGVPARRV